MARAVSECPNCGQPVSQFAAGCAICGENLVAARQSHAQRVQRLSRFRVEPPGWLGQLTGAEMILGALLLLIAIGFPVVAVFLTSFIAFFAHRNDAIPQRNLALVALAVALIVIALISFVPATWDELLPWVDLSGPLPTD